MTYQHLAMYSGTLERYHDFVQRVLQRHQWRSHMPRGFFNLPSLKVFLAERASDNNTEGSCGIPVKNSKVERLTLNLCRMHGSLSASSFKAPKHYDDSGTDVAAWCAWTYP